jgi:hypothetical protein
MHMHFDYGTERQCGAMFDDARHEENPFSSNPPNSDRIEYLIKVLLEDGEAPIGLTVSGLARSLPREWIDQERMFGLS